MSRAAAQTYGRYADILVEKGFGVVLYDIFYNTGVDRYCVSRGHLKYGLLSVIEFIKNKYPKLSNGKFGITGGSRGGMTALSLAQLNKRELTF